MKTKYANISFYGNSIVRGKYIYQTVLNEAEKNSCRYLLVVEKFQLFNKRQFFYHILSFFGFHDNFHIREYQTYSEDSVHVYRERAAPSQSHECILFGHESKGSTHYVKQNKGLLSDIYNNRVFDNIRLKIKNVSVSRSHTLFNTYKGDLFGFGENTYGELGLGHCNKIQTAIHIDSNSSVDNIACGLHYSIISYRERCFVAPLMIGVCGKNDCGQLGCKWSTLYLGAKNMSSHMGTPGFTKLFLDVKDCKIRSISCGWSHSLILFDDGRLMGSGLAFLGRLGMQNRNNKMFGFQFIDIDDDIQSISAGDTHSLIMSKNKVYTFGEGVSVPVDIKDIFKHIAFSGRPHCYKLRKDHVDSGRPLAIYAGRKFSTIVYGDSLHTKIVSYPTRIVADIILNALHVEDF